MSKFIAIDTNPWKLDDLYACVLLKAFDAPGCGVIVVTDNPDTLANATWVINSKVFNVLNAKFAEELEIGEQGLPLTTFFGVVREITEFGDELSIALNPEEYRND